MHALSRLREGRSRRTLALVALGVLLPIGPGCASWNPASIVNGPITQEARTVGTDPADLEGRQVRFHLPSGVVELTVTEVTFPYARGYYRTDAHRKATEEVDLREVSFVEVRSFDGRTAVGCAALLSLLLMAFYDDIQS